GRRNLLLVYHVGRERSYLLLLGGPAGLAEAYPLTVPARVAERVALPAPLPREAALAGLRGLVRPRTQPQPDLPAAGGRPGPVVPLGADVLRALVEGYLEEISSERFDPARGLRLPSRDPGRPLDPQRPELLAEVLLPARARQRIRARAPDCLVVVPD